MKSISEYFRLIHERDLLLEELGKPRCKSDKMRLLAELRDYDRLLEVDSGNYNSSDFGKVNK